MSKSTGTEAHRDGIVIPEPPTVDEDGHFIDRPIHPCDPLAKLAEEAGK